LTEPNRHAFSDLARPNNFPSAKPLTGKVYDRLAGVARNTPARLGTSVSQQLPGFPASFTAVAEALPLDKSLDLPVAVQNHKLAKAFSGHGLQASLRNNLLLETTA
jgi:hypothetical protein